jgi:peptide/nickel transport system substrate-binding protein
MLRSSKRLIVALAALLAVLSISVATTPVGAKTSTAVAKKKTTKKVAKKKTTKKRVTTTTAKKVERQLSAPAAGTQTAPKGRPADVNPDGELTVAYAAPPSSLDPARNSLTVFTYPLYDRLTQIDDSLQVRPMLATGWSFPNKSTFEMTLRDDVTFEDGSKFDAASVKATIERSKTLVGSLLAPQLRGITSVEVVSPTKVRFNLNAGGAELPSLFSGAAGEMMSTKVAQSGQPVDISTKGGGSGPYTVDTFSPNDRIVLKQSKTVTDGRYWDKRAGLLKKFTWVYLATSPQRINAVRSGDIDMGQVTGVDTAPAQQLIDSGQGYSGRHVTLQLTQVSLQIHQDVGIMSNKAFRVALQHAVDKSALVKGLYSGNCDAASQFYTKTHWAHSNAVDGKYDYDRDKAQKMIKDTGIFNPSFTLQYGPIYQAPAEAVAGMLGDYGINVKLKAVAQSDVSFRDGADEASLGALSVSGVDPAEYVTKYLNPTGTFKFMKDDGKMAADAALASDPTTSQAQAAKIYDSIFQRAADQAVIVHLCNTHQVWLQKGKVASLGEMPGTWSGLVDIRGLYVKK